MCFKRKICCSIYLAESSADFILLHQTGINIIRTILTTANLFLQGKKKKQVNIKFLMGRLLPS